MADQIKIGIEFADQAAQNALSNFIANAGKADKSMKSLNESGKSTFENITLGIQKSIGVQELFAGNLAANIFLRAFDGLKDSIHEVIHEAAVSEQAIKNLNVALQSSGQYTPKASLDFQEFAASIQLVTEYSDEAILASSSLLLNLTSLSNEGVKKATQAAVDLAVTLGKDLPTATEMIAKAIEGNTKAFKKLGIEIQSGSSDAERLTNILKALESQHGAAAKQADTFAGATAKAKNQQSELYEAVGKLVTQSTASIEATKALSSLYASSAQFINENADAIRDFGTALKITGEIAAGAFVAYTVATSAAVAASITLIGGLGLTSGAFVILQTAATAAWAAITAPITIIVAAVAAVVAGVYLLVRNWETVKAAVYDATAATLEFAAKGAEVLSSNLAQKLRDQATAYRDQATSIREAVEAAKIKAKEDAENDKLSDEQKAANAKRLADKQADELRHANFLRETAKTNATELTLIESDKYIKLADLDAQYEEGKALAVGAAQAKLLEQFNTAAQARLLAQQEIDRQELEAQILQQQAVAKAENDDKKRKEALIAADQKASISRITLQNKQELDLEKLKNDGAKKLDEQRLKDRANTLQLFATLSSSSNQTLATIGKAAAITQIAIDTPRAVSSAFAFGTAAGGPILGGIFAAIAATAEAAQAAQIAGVQFANGGIVPGTSVSGDLVQARVNSGEMVLNKVQQTNLFDIANGKVKNSNGDSGLLDKFNALASDFKQILNQPIIVQVDGRELFNITRNQLASGRTY